MGIVDSHFSICSEAQYGQAIGRLNALLEEVGDDENHPLYSLMDTLGTVIRAYEEKYYSMPQPSGVDMLCFFMEDHNLTHSDLPDIGSQGVVSEILNGRRELNIRHIRALAKRFGMSPAVFIDDIDTSHQ